MEVRHANKNLQRLETEANYSGGFGHDVVKAFRKRMQFIRSASDERSFYRMQSLHFEKLTGDRVGQYSMRLSDQYRLIMRLEKPLQTMPVKKLRVNELAPFGPTVAAIIEVVDYH